MGLKKPKQPRLDPYNAFLNIPYDNQFQNLYLAYISGLSAFGLFPKATLEIPGSKRRLDRIFGPRPAKSARGTQEVVLAKMLRASTPWPQRQGTVAARRSVSFPEGDS